MEPRRSGRGKLSPSAMTGPVEVRIGSDMFVIFLVFQSMNSDQAHSLVRGTKSTTHASGP